MPSGPLAFKETDVARAMRAASKAQLGPFHVRIERRTGDILILPGVPLPTQGARPATGEPSEEELDRQLAELDQQP